MYLWNLLTLWVAGKIDWHSVVYALRERPIAVAGRGGSYHVDPVDLVTDPSSESNHMKHFAFILMGLFALGLAICSAAGLDFSQLGTMQGAFVSVVVFIAIGGAIFAEVIHEESVQAQEHPPQGNTKGTMQ